MPVRSSHSPSEPDTAAVGVQCRTACSTSRSSHAASASGAASYISRSVTSARAWTYDFQTGRFAPGDPLPDWLDDIRARAARFAGIDTQALEQALLIQYGTGAGIGWHKDRPVFEHVIGISLGAPATMRFRRRNSSGFERASAELAARSIYHMDGEVRNDWEHSIAAMDEPRWSITFRSLR